MRTHAKHGQHGQATRTTFSKEERVKKRKKGGEKDRGCTAPWLGRRKREGRAKM